MIPDQQMDQEKGYVADNETVYRMISSPLGYNEVTGVSPLVSSFEEEYEYTCMLRATLSRYELVWLYYNGLSYGKERLKPLIERYAMLNNLRGDLLADKKDEFGSYEPSAWKKVVPSSFE